MDYYDGNTVTGAVELRPALRDERRLLRHRPSARRLRAPSTSSRAHDRCDVDPDHGLGGSLTDGDVVADDARRLHRRSATPSPTRTTVRAHDSALAMTGTERRRPAERRVSAGAGSRAASPRTRLLRPSEHRLELQRAQRARPRRLRRRRSASARPSAGPAERTGRRRTTSPTTMPFQYYASTANPHHLAPTSLVAVGTDTGDAGRVQHCQPQLRRRRVQHDSSRRSRAGQLPASHFPAVSFLKAPGYEDGHAGYSDPIDEQNLLVKEVNMIESLPTWKSTAIFITYDDSDGWYDHVVRRSRQPLAHGRRRARRRTAACGLGVSDADLATSRGAAATARACR